MSFTITIKNNENGEVLVNKTNAVAIIGALVTDDDQTGEMGFCACSPVDIAVACVAAKKAINRVATADKALSLAVKLAEELTEKKGAKSENE